MPLSVKLKYCCWLCDSLISAVFVPVCVCKFFHTNSLVFDFIWTYFAPLLSFPDECVCGQCKRFVRCLFGPPAWLTLCTFLHRNCPHCAVGAFQPYIQRKLWFPVFFVYKINRSSKDVHHSKAPEWMKAHVRSVLYLLFLVTNPVLQPLMVILLLLVLCGFSA